ncbi:MAG: type II toxin-antitoxin system Phd/YefM family antitoxin [Planctomycetes bacterium]|nr:type II toxin-antitoxin system Phd/YefM family antitoxin [Planctomycetota bacterium]
MQWQLAEAKNKFSEVVRRALTEGPQHINRRGDSVVVMSGEDYDRLAGQRPGFKELLMNGPRLDELDLKRDQTPLRDVQL